MHGNCRRRQKRLLKAAKGKSHSAKDTPIPVNGVYPFTCLGVTSEAFSDALSEYVTSNPQNTLKGEANVMSLHHAAAHHVHSAGLAVSYCLWRDSSGVVL